MLYIIDIDADTFGFSGTGAAISNVEVTFQKTYYAVGVNPVGDATKGLVSIKSYDQDAAIISIKKPSEMTLEGVVYPDAKGFVIAFNSIMGNVAVATTTSTTTTTETTTTTTAA